MKNKAETHKTNIRSRKMLEKIGFKEVSRIGSEEYLGTENQLIQHGFHFRGMGAMQKKHRYFLIAITGEVSGTVFLIVI